MILISVKYQLDGSNVKEIILKSSWHTHLKHSKPCTCILQKVKNPPDGFSTSLLFASATIPIFVGLFLHILSMLLNVKLKCLRVPIADFERRNCRTRRDNPKSNKTIWQAINKTPKGRTKNRPFVYCIILKDIICHILSSRVESSERIGFDSYWSTVIVHNYANKNIFSEGYFFTNKIETMVSNGVENIGGKDLVTKWICIVSWYWTGDEG